MLAFRLLRNVRQIQNIYNNSNNNLLYTLFALGSFVSLFEALGVALIFPLIALINDPSFISSSSILLDVFEFLNFSEVNSFIKFLCFFIAVVYCSKILFMVFFFYLQSKYSAIERSNLSGFLYKSYLNLSLQEYKKRNTSEYIRNIGHLVERHYADFIFSIIALVSDSIAVIGICFVLFVLQPKVILATCVVFGLLFLLQNKVFGPHFLKLGIDVAKFAGEQQKFLQESFSCIKEIKVFQAFTYFSKTFEDLQNRYIKYKIKYEFVVRLPHLLTEFILILTIFSIVGYILYDTTNSAYALPHLAILAASAFRLTPLFNRLIGNLNIIRHSSDGVNTLIQEVHNSRYVEGKNKFNRVQLHRAITLNNVSFSFDYSDRKILNKINLNIKFGESIGIVGSSGAGKSTLADLILGLLTPTEGLILHDGAVSPKNWNIDVGYVPQEPIILDRSLRENIAFGVATEDIDDQRVMKTLKLARLEDVYEKLSDGLNTILYEKGSILSGGQRQRICIARALYNDPEIIIFDEATSSLDALTEKNVSDTLYELEGKKTFIVIAHRLNTIRKCNRVVFLDAGEIVDIGTYDDLYASNLEFKKIVNLYISKD